MDREKVIKGLELCLKTIDEPDCRKECPYYEICQKYEGRVIFQPLMRDTLALLKEQEPAEPVMKKGRLFTAPMCRKCGYFFPTGTKPNYCQECGKAVKWK